MVVGGAVVVVGGWGGGVGGTRALEEGATHANPSPREMPVWNWMPSMADTTLMAGVSTPSEMIMLAASSTTTSSTVRDPALRSSLAAAWAVQREPQ